jgi:hypothetical protein
MTTGATERASEKRPDCSNSQAAREGPNAKGRARSGLLSFQAYQFDGLVTNSDVCSSHRGCDPLIWSFLPALLKGRYLDDV